MRNAVVLCAGLVMLTLPGVAGAQTQSTGMMPAGGHVFVSINGLYQPGEETFEQNAAYSVYEEPATATALQTVKNGGGMFDFGGGYRTKSFGVGISFTRFKSNNQAAITASIPHPLFFDRPRTVSTTLEGLEHTEHVVHLDAYYFVPLAEKMDVSVFIGPSFFSAKQDYVTGLDAFNESADFSTVTIPVGTGTAKDSPVGFNIGGEITYTVTPNVAGAFMLRFSRASADFEFDGAEHSISLGNVQVGGGLRFRF
jgi:hypothetical protein